MTDMLGHNDVDVVGAADEGDGVGWPLGWLEMRILRAVWERGEAAVRDVMADLTPSHPIAYTTTMTVMSRLADKGLLHRKRHGKTYHYTPAFTPEEFTAQVSRRMLHSLMAEFGEIAIAQFAAELERVDPDRLRRLRDVAEDQSAS